VRNLSVELFGQYNIILSTLVFYVLLLNLGIPSIILRYLPEYTVKGDFDNAKRIMKSGLFITLGLGIVLIFVSFLITKYYRDLIYRFSLTQFLFIAAFLGLLRVQIRILKAVFSSVFQKGFQNLFENASMALKLSLIIFTLAKGYGLMGVFISIGIADLFLVIAYLMRIFGYFKNKQTTVGEISKKRFLRFGLKEYFAKLLSFFWEGRIDAYFIIFYLGAYATGIFYFVINTATMLIQYMPGTVMQPVAQALFARQYTKSKSPKELNYLFQLSNKVNVFFIFPAFLGLSVLIDKIIPYVFGVKYVESSNLFPIILFFMIFYLLLFPLRSIITALEKSEITLLCNLVILYKIPALILLTKKFGLYGTAFALGTSIIIYFFITLFLTKKLIKIQYPWLAFGKILFNSIIVALFFYFTRSYIHNTFSLISVIVIGGLIYIIVSYLNKAFSKNDRMLINQPFKRAIFVF
jgi:O-antigen/teichoic acid export membrane protein